MAEGENVHPGSWVGDTVEEFKKLPTWGKIAAGGVVVAVAGFAYYQWKQSQGVSASASSSGLGIPGGATDTGSGGGTDTGGTTTGTGGTTTGTGGGAQPPTGILPIGPIQGKPISTPKPPSPPKLQTYTVQRGDNLSEIAAKLHIKGGWQALYNANKSVIGSNPNLIYAGTKLKIPS